MTTKQPTNGTPDWKLTQVLGDCSPADQIDNKDIISAIEFDTTGNYLAVGDQAGRVIIFNKDVDTQDYQYLTEFQSHELQFDYLKSVEIEERVNQIQWLQPQGQNLYLLTTNDKEIKAWKISEKLQKTAVSMNNTDLDANFPRLQVSEKSMETSLLKTYPQLHSYNINSLSRCSNGENFLSGDDLSVNLWTLERGTDAYNIVDLKPENIEEISEVITSAKFHPTSDTMFLYSTSRGVVQVGDLRKSSQCEKTVMTLEDKEGVGKKNFFTDIIVSICDAEFSKDGKYIFSRDFCTVKVWDLANTSRPVKSIQVYEPIKTKLCELYENECIFDKFGICSGSDSSQVLTGMYNNNFHIIDVWKEVNKQLELNFENETVMRIIPKKCSEVIGSNYDYSKKVLKASFHPKENVVAVASLNAISFYKS